MNANSGGDLGVEYGAIRFDHHAVCRSASTCRNHWPSWFQLAKMRLTRFL
jgi:hypothetical protein